MWLLWLGEHLASNEVGGTSSVEPGCSAALTCIKLSRAFRGRRKVTVRSVQPQTEQQELPNGLAGSAPNFGDPAETPSGPLEPTPETTKPITMDGLQRGILVAWGGIEPPTRGFSIRCSTN